MEEKKKDIVVNEKGAVQDQEAISPSHMIQIALQQDLDIEKLEKLIQLKERFEVAEAIKQYNVSMSDVHRKMPSVAKTEKNNQTSSLYASLSGIINTAKPIYSEEGFAVSFYEEDSKLEGHVRICVDLTHRSGHHKTYHYDMPLDGKGIKGNVNMTAIHAKASSMAYGRRYLMCMVFNIPTGDDDGNAAGQKSVECIDDKQLNWTLDMIAKTEANLDGILKYMKVDSLELIPKKDFSNLEVLLKKKKEAIDKEGDRK